MVSAVVLLKVDRGRINDVGSKMAELSGVTEVYSVGGRYDLIAIIRVKENRNLSDLVTEKMHQFEGILESETLIAFRVYSEHDLESMFSIGLE